MTSWLATVGRELVKAGASVGIGYEIGKSYQEKPIVINPTLQLPKTESNGVGATEIGIIVAIAVLIIFLLLAFKAFAQFSRQIWRAREQSEQFELRPRAQPRQNIHVDV